MREITVETIVGYINQLSTPDRARLYRILSTEAMKPAGTNGAVAGQKKTKPLPMPVPDPEPSRRWMEAHRSEYAGQWVALDGARLIAAAATEGEVADAADTDGAYLPLIGYIPHPDEPTFIGLRMAETLTFEITYLYADSTEGIAIPVAME
ncbi:MAG TPA: DUF5678 domain-containing protein [Blastocatellia bacterium]|nr:DUF5678 domain-containing protein [Blastocatellia bacterium]